MRMPERMAADRDRNRETCDMRRAPLNVYGECRRRAPQLGPDAGLVDHLEELFLQLCILGHGMTLIDRARKSLLREECRTIHRAADADADDLRRARIRAGVLDDLHDSLLHTLDAISRNEHFHTGLILRTEALRCDRNAEAVARDDLRVDDTRRIVLCVLTIKERLGDDGLAQIAFRVALRDTLVNRMM